jgi:hypothetical protein
MRVVVNHLTRMDAPRICVAAIVPDTGRHIRPVTGAGDLLTRDLLAENGGPFALGTLVDLGDTTPKPEPPETEDCLFRPARIKVVEQLSPERYLGLLRRHAQRRLRSIFGDVLARQGRSYAVEKGCGEASLGIMYVRRGLDLDSDGYGKLRVRLDGEGRPAYLPVTDVRFVEADHKTIKLDVLVDVRTRMLQGVEVFLMLGLARPFQREGDDRRRHWLQVNGICMADRPLGERP